MGGANANGQVGDEGSHTTGAVVADIEAGRWGYHARGDAPCSRTGHTCVLVHRNEKDCARDNNENEMNTNNGNGLHGVHGDGDGNREGVVVVLGGCSLRSGYLSLRTAHVMEKTAAQGEMNKEEWKWTAVETRGEAPSPRDKHLCFAMPCDEGAVYVYGGFGPDETAREDEDEEGEGEGFAAFKWFDDLYRLDLTSWVWEKVVSAKGIAPSPRAAAACCVLGDERLLVFGGRGAAGRLNDTYTLEWQRSGDGGGGAESKAVLVWTRHGEGADVVPAPRSFHAMHCMPSAASNAAAFLFGGIDAENTLRNDLWALDTRDMRWRDVSAAEGGCEPRAGAVLASSGDTLVIVGGYTEASFFDDVLSLQAPR